MSVLTLVSPLVLGAPHAAAQSANTPANGVAPSATNPPNQPNPNLAVVFEPSAADLPQAEIRAAIARELGAELAPPDSIALPTLSIGVAANHLVVRFQSADGVNERLLPLPEERAQIPVLLSLIAGNLARDQRSAVRPDPAPPEPETKTAPAELPPVILEPWPTPVLHASPAPNITLAFKRLRLGVHLAQDVMYVGGDDVWNPNLGQVSDNYACFEGRSSTPFFGHPHPAYDKVSRGLALATTRVLLSLDYALSDRVTLGARAGYAFQGGPPAGMTPDPQDPGTPFLPWHLEARASYWLLPLSTEPWHAYVGASAGLLQVDAPNWVDEIDCTNTQLGATSTTEAEQRFQRCVQGSPEFTRQNMLVTGVTAWKKTGQFMLGAHAGATLTLAQNLEALVNFNAMYMLPAIAVVLEPSLGVSAGF